MKKNYAIIIKYFFWLKDRLSNNDEYSKLLFILFNTPFTWLENVPKDENRKDDALSLRKCFMSEIVFPGLDYDSEVEAYKILMTKIPSVLEVFIALCERCQDIIGDDIYNATDWFWLIIENLRIRYNDSDFITYGVEEDIHNKLDIFLNRTYDDDGNGSAFPGDFYKNLGISATKVELWYQCQWYLTDAYG